MSLVLLNLVGHQSQILDDAVMSLPLARPLLGSEGLNLMLVPHLLGHLLLELLLLLQVDLSREVAPPN